MAKKIYLSPSEQPTNMYAYGNTNEKAVCREISAYTEEALKRHGFEVINATATKLAVRCTEANNWGADLYIPIHTNAHNGKVSGTRMFCYSLSGEGYKACQAIYNVLAPITPGTSENIKAYPGLYEVNTPKAPTVYIEVDFHDVPEVAKWLVEHTKDIGEAICNGVCNHYGVAYKAVSEPVVDVPVVDEPVVEQPTKTLTQIAREVLKGKWGNGSARKANLTAAGYDYNAVQKEVNRLVNSSKTTTKKSNEEIAKEVIQGKWGNGADRKTRLTNAGYDYATIQSIVNKLL